MTVVFILHIHERAIVYANKVSSFFIY